jgi:hypothetical protein
LTCAVTADVEGCKVCVEEVGAGIETVEGVADGGARAVGPWGEGGMVRSGSGEL